MMTLKRFGITFWVLVSAYYFGNHTILEWQWWLAIISIALALMTTENLGRIEERKKEGWWAIAK